MKSSLALAVSFILLYKPAFAQQPAKPKFCTAYTFSTEIFNWVEKEGKRTKVPSGHWDLYDPNGSSNPMPDTVYIVITVDILSYSLHHSFLKGDEVTEDFDIEITAQAQHGLTTNCRSVTDPAESKPLLLQKTHIRYNRFFRAKTYKPVQLKVPLSTQPLLALVGEDRYLTQIVVTSHVRSIRSGQRCKVRYALPICP